MAFGSYNAVCLKKAKEKQSSVNTINQTPVGRVPDMPDKKIDNIMEISIVLVGRTVASATDFISGLYENMSSIASSLGLAFFSEDNSTIREILSKQKFFSTAFIENDTVSYLLSDADMAEPIRLYSLILSKAGVQHFSFKINFICTTAEYVLSGKIEHFDILWFLADAPLFEKNLTDFSNYPSEAAELMEYVKENNRPVYLIAGQFEKVGKIRINDSVCAVESDVYAVLKECIKNNLGEAAIDRPILPVQIYGGLAYKETDADGNLVFGENRFGGLNMYKPVGCHIPLLYSLEMINAGEQFNDNEIVARIKKLNREQRSAFSYYGIETGG